MLEKSCMKSASGAVHLMGSFSPTTLTLEGGKANPKSATLKHSNGKSGHCTCLQLIKDKSN